MASLPTEAEILARAKDLGLVAVDAETVPHDVRKRVASVILDERQNPKPPAAGAEIKLLSRATHPVDGGEIRVDVVFIPNPTKEPTHG